MGLLELSAGGIATNFAELLGAPFKNPGILWLGLPLILTLIVIELNLKEDKKWHPVRTDDAIKQALPNALVLLFVGLDLMRQAFIRSETFFGGVFSGPFFASFLVLSLAVVLFLIDYHYGFPTKKWLGVSLHLPINTFAYTMMVYVYSQVAFSLNLFGAMVVYVAMFGFIFFTIARLENEVIFTPHDQWSDRHDKRQSKNSPVPRHKMIWEDDAKEKGAITFTFKKDKEPKKDQAPPPDSVSDPFQGVKVKFKKD